MKKVRVNGKSIRGVMRVASITIDEATAITGLGKSTLSDLLIKEDTYIQQGSYGKLCKLFSFIFSREASPVGTAISFKRYALYKKPTFAKPSPIKPKPADRQLVLSGRVKSVKTALEVMFYVVVIIFIVLFSYSDLIVLLLG